jgi:phosphoribosylglycinamide formyltransferase-1
MNTPIDLCDYLAKRRYPGRGIVLGRSADGLRAVIAYFIMGRSENSRNRVFTVKDGGIVTEAADPSKMTDPSLIIYAPVRLCGPHTIVTNGDQTDTVFDALENGGTFEAALRTRTFEPDAPNFTPRISGLLSVTEGAMAYRLSILKSDGGDPHATQRFFFEYDARRFGEGRLMHTYVEGETGLPSFAGEPVQVCTPCADIDLFAAALWNALDMQNRVSLFVRTVDLLNGHSETRILNQRG